MDRPRAAVRAAGVGTGLGAAGVLALVAAGRSVDAASAVAFSVGALVFGFALTGWAGTAMLGNSLSAVHRELDTSSDWTPEKSRQAMALLALVGAGAMVGAALATLALA